MGIARGNQRSHLKRMMIVLRADPHLDDMVSDALKHHANESNNDLLARHRELSVEHGAIEQVQGH